MQVMKRTKFRITLQVISHIVIFCLGFVISKVVSIPGVYLSLEINPTHLISILATVFIALVLSIGFDFYKEKRKVEKGLIFQRLNETNEIIDKINEYVENGVVPTPVMNSSNKRLRSTISFIFEVMNKCEMETLIGAKEVDDLVKKILDLMTNTPAMEEGSTL